MTSGPAASSTMTIHLRQVTRPDGRDRRHIPAESTAGDCPVCPHPADTHDEIGARYSAATAAGGCERGCVCTTGEPKR